MQLNRKEFLGLVTRGAAALAPRHCRGRDSVRNRQGPSWPRSAPTWRLRPARTLPPRSSRRAKHHILDTFAAMVSGSELPPGRAALALARAAAGGAVGTVAGSRVLCGPIEAALANGVLAHSDETDDSHGPSQSHPGSAVVPAALAAGEQFGADGARFHARRRARLRHRPARDDGARRREVSKREPPQHAQHRRHVRRVGGGRLRRAPERAADALAARLRRRSRRPGFAAWERDTDHIEKGFVFAGMPARNGVTAALARQPGVDRRRRRVLGRRQLLRGARADGQSGRARRASGRALRGRRGPTSRSGRSVHPSRRRSMRWTTCCATPSLRAPIRCSTSSFAWRPAPAAS